MTQSRTSRNVASTITVDQEQAVSAIERCMRARLSVFLKGSPGTGKSQMIQAIAQRLNLKLIDLRLAQCDPTDLNGFPQIRTVTRDDGTSVERAGYAPMDTFPIEGDPLPLDASGKPMNGWLLFMDEMNHADRATQKASYRVILDREVGQYKLHPNIGIVAAGNLETDNAFVEEMSSALKSRFVHLELALDNEQWISWATDAGNPVGGIDHRIVSFVRFKPTELFRFDPNQHDATFPTPRTWEFASRLVKGTETLGREYLALLAGTVGQGTAREFLTFCRIYEGLVTIEQILASPTTTAVPDEPSVLYALSGSIASRMEAKNVADLVTYLRRMPPEFQVITLRDVAKRTPALIKHEAIIHWAKETSRDLSL